MDISINGAINISLQVGDVLYTTLLTNDQSGVNTSTGHKPSAFGIVTAISFGSTNQIISVDTTGFVRVTLTSNHYLFFSKNNAVNTSGVLGYYASVEYRNYSRKKAEIFATGTEYAPSSK